MMLKVFSARALTGPTTAMRGIRRLVRPREDEQPLDPPRPGNLLRIDRKQWRPVKFLIVSSNKPVRSVLIVRDGREPVEIIRPARRADSWHVFRAE